MPYKSDAQRRYFHYLESKGKMPKKTVDEFDLTSRGDDLPEYVEQHAEGGEAGSDDPYSSFGKNVAENAGNNPDATKQISKSFMAHGGMTEDEETSDYMADDSSGEPHTEGELEEEHPMEYMSIGGSIGNVKGGGLFGLAKGGRVGAGKVFKQAHHMEEMPHMWAGGPVGEGPAANNEEDEEPDFAMGHSGSGIDHGPASENEHDEEEMPPMSPSRKKQKMASGGMVHHAFAKAIAKSRGMK